MKHLTIISDTKIGTTSGVVTAILQIKKILETKDFKVSIIHPGMFFGVHMPNYPEIKLSFPMRKIKAALKEQKPDYIHIATEGPIGLAARRVCLANNWKFTSSYHTRFPEYVDARVGVLKKTTYRYLRWFHSKSQRMMVSTPSLRDELSQKGFKNIAIAPLGVDCQLFQKNPTAKKIDNLKSPVFVFLGRLAVEKNIEAFLKCDLPGSKLIIGDGPQRHQLEREFKNQAIFVGYQTGQNLVDLLSISNVLVFPSKTDTFGLTIIEALACELPVAAFDVQGPRDIITNGIDGFLGDNLRENALRCLTLKATDCRVKALQFSWEQAGDEFIKYLASSGINQ